MTSAFTVKFWGVRGTVPCPGADTVRYGGNTSCVEVRCGETLLIFDAGSGLRQLGRALAAETTPLNGHLFLTHTHLDHVLGLPFFKPAYAKGHRLELWNGHLLRQNETLRSVLGRIMETPYFPVPIKLMHSCTAFHDFEAGDTIDVAAGLRVRTGELVHPGGATGYRVEHAGRAFCYITDTEHDPSRLDENILRLIEGADLVVYDATYTEEEFPRFKGWGHSTWEQGAKLCREAQARQLAAFHHDPEHDDAFMDRLEHDLAQAMPGSFVAREGMTLALT